MTWISKKISNCRFAQTFIFHSYVLSLSQLCLINSDFLLLDSFAGRLQADGRLAATSFEYLWASLLAQVPPFPFIIPLIHDLSALILLLPFSLTSTVWPSSSFQKFLFASFILPLAVGLEWDFLSWWPWQRADYSSDSRVLSVAFSLPWHSSHPALLFRHKLVFSTWFSIFAPPSTPYAVELFMPLHLISSSCEVTSRSEPPCCVYADR